MKKIFIITTFIFVFIFTLLPNFSLAQGMMGDTSTVSDGHTAHEEAEGKAVWEKLQTKELTCKDLSDDNFGTLGEYFMSQMMGDSHETMNNMIIQMMGEKEEEQIHVVMGKRLSGCDTSAAFSSQGMGFMPMMNMMWGGSSGLNQGDNSMMNFGSIPFGWFGWILMILWWVLIIAGIVVLVRWISNQNRGGNSKSAIDILKERYAKGEIDKKEFEERKKDLS